MPPKRKAAAKGAAGGKKAKASPPAKTTKGKKEETEEEEAPGSGNKKSSVAKEEVPEVKTTAKDTRAKGGKKAAATDEEEPTAATSAKQLADALKKAGAGKKKTHKVDSYCYSFVKSGKIVDDYDCMLNQTNIGQNNNKYYVIQLIENAGNYYVWTRWGRVGEPGANDLKHFQKCLDAVVCFKKKFQDKTKNKWENRDAFTAAKGKYTLLEMGDDEEEEDETAAAGAGDSAPASAVYLPCTLDPSTQELVKLIFDNNMFQDALKDLEIDTSKMPLGKISKSQIAKGFEALEKIEEALKNNQRSKLAELSSQFYTVIPHNFGRRLPDVINTDELLRKKMDMLTVLADIELAQAMQKENEVKEKPKKAEKSPHPLDVQYGLLQCQLKLMDTKSDVFKMLDTYKKATQGYNRSLKILDVWEVDRSTEGQRFSANDSIDNRKLLWHGTNVAVVAAILKSGLRIMPHSGGRVGKGIYFASENSKSASYVGRAAGGIGIMFLNEVALGTEHHISQDNSSLRKPPAGFNSIVARGRTEPDPQFDKSIELDGHRVVVPQGKPVAQRSFENSSFSQSEYLVYREDQCRIRYLLKLKF